MAEINNNTTNLFDAIAKRYDLANRLISFGFDRNWRYKLIEHMPDKANMRTLDLACGTGDIAILADRTLSNISDLTALDCSTEMLEIAIRKAGCAGINFIEGDMHSLPFADGSFDCVTLAFGLRNADNPELAVKEIQRVLADDGVALILEFYMPDGLAGFMFNLYFRYVMPVIGGIVTGDYKAYKYLHSSVRDFYKPVDLCDMLNSCGLDCKTESLFISAVNLFYCQKKK